MTCTGAPPSASGLVLLGAAAASTPIVGFGPELWIDPAGAWFLFLQAFSDAFGASTVALPLPRGSAGAMLHAQFVWAGPSAPPPCPPQGLSASEGLAAVVQR